MLTALIRNSVWYQSTDRYSDLWSSAGHAFVFGPHPLLCVCVCVTGSDLTVWCALISLQPITCLLINKQYLLAAYLFFFDWNIYNKTLFRIDWLSSALISSWNKRLISFPLYLWSIVWVLLFNTFLKYWSNSVDNVVLQYYFIDHFHRSVPCRCWSDQ